MFSKHDFLANMTDLRAMEENMRSNYASIVHEIDDEDLLMQFTALMQAERRHARLVEMIEEIVGKSIGR